MQGVTDKKRVPDGVSKLEGILTAASEPAGSTAEQHAKIMTTLKNHVASKKQDAAYFRQNFPAWSQLADQVSVWNSNLICIICTQQAAAVTQLLPYC